MLELAALDKRRQDVRHLHVRGDSWHVIANFGEVRNKEGIRDELTGKANAGKGRVVGVMQCELPVWI